MPFATWRIRRLAASILVLLLGLGGTKIYAGVLNGVQPIESWLVWQLVPLWLALLVFSAAATSFGRFVLERALKMPAAPALEATVLSMAVGTIAFVLCLFVAGVLGLYGPAFALLLPALFLVVGARSGFQLLVRLRRDSARTPHTWTTTAAAGFGLVCLALQYLALMTPDALNYDSTWHHLKVAQDYARWRAIRPFPGDYNPALPHLTGVLHTWGFLLPGLHQAQRWMLALHLEFCLFLWTLAGVAAGVQRLLARYDLRSTWAAFFLFPIIFVYDSNIGGAADHVFAFFVMPTLLAALVACRTFSRSACVVLGVCLGGAALTKYQVVYLATPVLALFAGAWIFAGVKRRLKRPPADEVAAARARREWLWAPLLVAASGLAVFSPQPLLNLVFHHNPVYPFLQRLFTASTPSVPNGWLYVANIFQDNSWVPRGSFLQKLEHAVRLFFTFSFEPHYSFTKNIPAFGSLFTLLLPGLLLVRRRRAIAPAAFVASSAVLLWALTFNVDRNLQTFAPALVCVTAALIVELWQLGLLARLGLVPLIALQLAWGGDAPFYSSYDKLRSSLDLIRTSYEGRAAGRLDGYRSSYVAIGNALPKDAVVLLHGSHLSLGVDRDVLLDWTGFQGLIHYGHVRTPRELWDYYRRLGVTHLLYSPGERTASSKQEEVLFNALAVRHGGPARTFGGYRLVPLSERPAEERPYRVLCLGLGSYADGLYEIAQLGTIEPLPERLRVYAKPNQALTDGNASELLSRADAVISSSHSPSVANWDATFKADFEAVIRYSGAFGLWLRR